MPFGTSCVARSAQDFRLAQLAEELGFDSINCGDSQSVFREMYIMAGLCAHVTKKIRLVCGVTNPITRHPAVAASAIATVDELSGGRAVLAIGSGDSAVLNLGERPARMADTREYIGALRSLFEHHEAGWRGKRIRLNWAERPVPIWLCAEGPKTLHMAGEIADGAVINPGLQPELLKDAVARIHEGARQAGRDPKALEIMLMVRMNICDDPAAGLEEIKMELASNAHHVFRFTFEGKQVPPDLVEPIRRVQQSYKPSEHEQVGGANAKIMSDPVLVKYLADRFAVVGQPDYCVQRLREIMAIDGIKYIRITGHVHDREAQMRLLAEKVLSRLR